MMKAYFLFCFLFLCACTLSVSWEKFKTEDQLRIEEKEMEYDECFIPRTIVLNQEDYV